MTLIFQGASEGLLLWFHTLLPSILPFLVLTKMFLFYRLPDKLAPLLLPVRKLLRLSPAGTFPVLIGLLSGYPVAAGVCADLTRQGVISRREGQFLLFMTNQASPPYIMTYLAVHCLGHPELGLPLFLIIHISSFLTGLILRPLFGRETFTSGHRTPTGSSDLPQTFAARADTAILQSFETMAKVGGYVMLASVLLTLTCNFLPPALLGCIEITAGSAAIASSGYAPATKTALLAAVTVFGGLSGLAQTQSVTEHSGLSLLKYAALKIPAALLAAAASWAYVTWIL